MGLFSDLAMGLGLKDRDASYYDRTAATLGRTQGAGREAQYRQSRAYTEQPTRGGPAAMIGGVLDRRQGGQRGGWGYGEGDQRVSALRDMLDGGGRGRAGQRFEGGMLADLANALGFRPLGYQERLAASRPMARPTRPAAPAAPNWAGAQEGMALEGQRLPLGTPPASPLSFGGGGAMPDWANFVGTSPLAFGTRQPFVSQGEKERLTQMEPTLEPSLPPMQYSGRGYVGMPMQPNYANDPYKAELLGYLRSVGAVNY